MIEIRKTLQTTKKADCSEVLASLPGFEPGAFRLGVDSEPPNCSKIGNFLANLALLCVFFVYFALFFMF